MLDAAVPTLVRLLAACGPPVPPQYNRVVRTRRPPTTSTPPDWQWRSSAGLTRTSAQDAMPRLLPLP
jgi:hypothetical protein